MAGDNGDLSAGSCKNSSAYYDRPDHSILSDIDPDFNYLNSNKESVPIIIIKLRSTINIRVTVIFHYYI